MTSRATYETRQQSAQRPVATTPGRAQLTLGLGSGAAPAQRSGIAETVSELLEAWRERHALVQCDMTRFKVIVLPRPKPKRKFRNAQTYGAAARKDGVPKSAECFLILSTDLTNLDVFRIGNV